MNTTEKTMETRNALLEVLAKDFPQHCALVIPEGDLFNVRLLDSIGATVIASYVDQALPTEEARKLICSQFWEQDRAELSDNMYHFARRQAGTRREQVNTLSNALLARKELEIGPSKEVAGMFCYSRQQGDSPSRRVRSSIGRIARRQLGLTPEQVSDAMLGELSVYLSATYWPDETAILKAYRGGELQRQYERMDDDIASCMTGDDADKTNLYASNREKVGLYCLEQGGKVLARCLVWTTDDSTTVIDRVYAANATLAEQIKSKIKELFPEAIYRGDAGLLYVTMHLPNNGLLPYIDTFCYGFLSRGKLTLSNMTKRGAQHLQQTGGKGLWTCDSCGETVLDMDWEEDAPYYCEKCRTHCEHCGRHICPDDEQYETANGLCPACAEKVEEEAETAQTQEVA